MPAFSATGAEPTGEETSLASKVFFAITLGVPIVVGAALLHRHLTSDEEDD